MSYVRLDTGNRWRRQQPPVQNAAAAIKLKYLPVKKLLVHVTGAAGILRKSADSGKTWTNATMLAGATACLDVCEDPDGNIWGLFSTAGTAKVGVSANAMASWTLKYTHTAAHQAFNISVSPERAAFNRIAFTARDATGIGAATGNHFEVVISTDSGGTWATKAVGYRLTDDQDEPLIQLLAGKTQVMFRGRKNTEQVSIWDTVTTQDIRFVTHWGNGWADPGLGDGVINPLTDRAVVVLVSASGDPSLSVTGATATLLDSFTSPTPANFGGDGTAWWRIYYLEPTADFVDFTGTSGAFRNCTFFRNPMSVDRVERQWLKDLSYTGSHFGTSIEDAEASQGSDSINVTPLTTYLQYGDMIWNWIWDEERTIDDLFFDKLFHLTNLAEFNHDYSRHNSAFIPFTPSGGASSSIDWWINNINDGNSRAMTAHYTATAVASTFPGACRILAVDATLTLRGIRDSTEDVDPSTWVLISGDNGVTWEEAYRNTAAPLPVELTRYGDTSPSFGAVADPNQVIRSTGGVWSVFNDPLTVGGETDNIASLAYDLITDRLFLSYIGSKRIFALLHASVADAAQANSAVDAASATLFDEGVSGYWQVIPSTEAAPVTYRQLISHKKTRLP